MKKNRKVLWIGSGILGVLILAGALFMISTADALKKLTLMPISDVTLNKISDGTYEGSYACFPISVILDVSVKDHMITAITIVKHVNGQGKPAEAILDKVILTQSLQVDTVTGATYSSKVILKAIQNALNP